MELCEATIAEINSGLRQRIFSVMDVVQSCLERIEKLDGSLNAFITKTPELALDEAKGLDKRLAEGEEVGPLSGVPIAHKDVFSTKDIVTTAASKILHGYIPTYDATVVERLKDVGTIMLGKTNCDEFAQGASGEYSAFDPTKNPWDLERVPGGSSSGSAAAVASGEVLLATGTDTGGSIRLPASFCNLVGLKPTYGRVSRFGVVAMASSLDCPGILARNVEDCFLGYQAVAGHDSFDATSSREAVSSDFEQGTSLKGLKIGLPKEYFTPSVSSDVSKIVKTAVQVLSDLDAEVMEVSLPHTQDAIPVYYIITPAEISSNLARYDGVRFGPRAEEAKTIHEFYEMTRQDGFGEESKRRILMGTFALSSGYTDEYYKKAVVIRQLIREDFLKVFQDVDVLLSPVSPTPPFKLGEKMKNPVEMYEADLLTIPASLAGIPALALPCGFVGDTLPVGMQLMGPHFKEGLLFKVASVYQSQTDWHNRRTNLKFHDHD